MSFEFRYQRILDVRELEEDQEQAEFVEIRNRLREEEQKLESLKEELNQHFEKTRDYRKGSAPALQRFRQHASRLNQKIEEQQNVVEEWEDKLEEQRDELIEASQKRQVLERLKEQDLEEFREELREAEQRQQEEVANQQYHQDENEG
jgi:flagellar FliJ protein